MGNPFVYVQLQTQDLEKAKAFYEKLFEWSFNERTTPYGPYVELNVGEGTGGGMVGQRDPSTASRWLPYVVVRDIAATTALARSLGGTVVTEPVRLPNQSQFSVILDPTGAMLALHQRAPE